MSAAPKRHRKIATGAGGIFGIVLAYAFLSRGFDTGSYWHYLGAVVFLILGLKLVARTFKNYEHTR